MDDFEELEGLGSVDFTQPDNIQAEPGQRTGEDAKGEATVLAQTVANSSSESRVEPFSKSGLEASSEEAARTGQPKGETANDFTSWERLLLSSEKGGLGWKNSKYFKRVQNALEKTAVVLSKNFSNVAEDNKAMLLEACNAFQALLDACKQYTARNPRTKNGKARRDIVLQIQDYAEKDLRGCGSKLFEFYSMSPDDQSKETWQSVLGGVRAMQLTVADYSKLGSAKGGQASDVIKIESPDGDPIGTKYFKKEDSLNLDVIKEKGEDAPFYFALQETLDKYPGLKEKDKKLLEELQYNGNVESIDFSEEGVLAALFCQRRFGQLREVITNLMESLGITEEDGMANMSRRNVATSRIAELLGLGKLVAKSQTVDILDQATGQTIRGNLMDQAEGKEYSEVENLIQENKITSGFLRDVTNLQVLDMLCGQVDRHAKNMLYKTDEGKVTGVQGIDNDAAFGTNTDVTSAKNRYRKDLRVFDPNTLEMIIPYMDDELATRISELDENVVGYVLKDLLTDEEIEAVGKRLRILKDGISKARETQKDRFLTKDQWTVRGNDKDTNKKTVEEEMLNSYDNYTAMEKMDSDVFKQRVKDLAAVRYKNDPETLRAIILLIDDKDKFQNDYEFAERQKLISAKAIIDQEVKREFLTKYLANRNYFGRIVRNQM